MFFIYDALDISVDSSGHLWASGRDPRGLIRVYDPDARGEAEPVRVIAGAGVDPGRLMGFDVDGRGNSYVATDDTVVVYSPGARDGDPPIRKIAGPDTFLRTARDLAIGPGTRSTYECFRLLALRQHGATGGDSDGVCARRGRNVEPVRSS